jgi:hypothetical protein
MDRMGYCPISHENGKQRLNCIDCRASLSQRLASRELGGAGKHIRSVFEARAVAAAKDGSLPRSLHNLQGQPHDLSGYRSLVTRSVLISITYSIVRASD